MNTAEINKIVSDAYSRLDVLNNIQWTAYRDVCCEMAATEERKHRGSRMGYSRDASVLNAARMFVVLRIAEALLGKRFETKDLLHVQPSAFYAASIVANYEAEIRAAWADLEIRELVALDYCEFVGSK